jgi:membrane fusion protein, multidrug efflux system
MPIRTALVLVLVLLAGPALAQAPGRSFDCVLKPSAELKLSAPVAGLIASVAVDRGSVVRKGDVVAVLDSRVEAASVAIAKRRSEATTKVNSAQAKVVFLERKSVRSRLLSKTQIVSESALEEAETNLAVAREDAQEALFDIQMARLELERATAILDQRTVRSPIDGVVTERKLAPGEYWAEREAAVTLAALNPLHVEAFLPVALHGRVRLGDQAVIRPEEPVGGAYDAVVEVIDRVYDAASGTFGLRLKLPNADLSIPAGIRCRIAFQALKD